FVKGEIAVLVVHDDGVAELGEVKADLMQAAGFNRDTHEGRVCESLHDTIAGKRTDHRAFAAGQREVDFAFVGWQAANNEAEILLIDFAGLESAFQFLGGFRGFGYYKQSGSVLIDPVDELRSHSRIAVLDFQDAVDRISLPVGFAFMDGEAGGLIYDEQAIVLKNNIELPSA
ncbi:MAG TPA: hypothetical protein VLA17_13900, partial [Candidatus Limnocylindria bacterium]|nr:hypothetical protein [Candidatus Limnocylindria bacterium]